MAKKSKKTRVDEASIDKTIVDKYARILQMIAIVGLLIIVCIDETVPVTEIPNWIKWGMFGIALGLSPSEILNILKSILGVKK